MTSTEGNDMNASRLNSNHTAHCLAAAMICTIENLRDSDNPAFTLTTHHDQVAFIAEGYLWDGVTACRCKEGKG